MSPPAPPAELSTARKWAITFSVTQAQVLAYADERSEPGPTGERAEGLPAPQ